MGIKYDRTQSNLAGMYPMLVIPESKTAGHCEVMSLGKQLFIFLYISGLSKRGASHLLEGTCIPGKVPRRHHL